jgi:hypothetical protein
MSYGIEYVRVVDEAGNHYSQPAAKAVPEGHSLLDGHPATNSNGDPLPVKPKSNLEAADGLLHGDALKDALAAAGLPKTGTVSEQQARLAEYQASSDEAATTTQEETA